MAWDTQGYEAALHTRTIGRTLRHVAVTPSTMDLGREAGQTGEPHGLVIVADEQTAGRGRFGRRWVAPAGANLTFTVLVRPDQGTLERLSIVAALAVADAARAVASVEPSFKWPNDVQIDGRKLAGILVEAEFRGEQPNFALVGIGLNVNVETAAVAEIAEIAVSLRDAAGHGLAREATLAALLHSFERWYERATDDTVIAAWSERLVTLGQEVRVSFAGEIEQGVAESVTSSGALRLRRADGSLVILPAGEVTTRMPA